MSHPYREQLIKPVAMPPRAPVGRRILWLIRGGARRLALARARRRAAHGGIDGLVSAWEMLPFFVADKFSAELVKAAVQKPHANIEITRRLLLGACVTCGARWSQKCAVKLYPHRR